MVTPVDFELSDGRLSLTTEPAILLSLIGLLSRRELTAADPCKLIQSPASNSRIAPAIEVRRFVKRTMDIFISIVMMFLFSPLCLLAAVLIKLTDGGPILFWQTRIGRNGNPFPFPKFRSMVPNADKMLDSVLHLNHHSSGHTVKVKRDPRTTWVGRILRKTSLDELPQLWCVLQGHMTLVGPRPAVPREVDRYTAEERRRLDATPGLTGIWQVSGRADLPFAKQVELDVKYIETQSLWLDIKLLFRTIPAVLTGRGAY